MIDYEILKVIWWLFIGVLLVGFAVMDGHDMGVGSLLPFLGKDDNERRVMINSVAPHWDGNQVWLITGGGAMFAAWPMMYATAFSGFYWAMLVLLMALIFRPVAFGNLLQGVPFHIDETMRPIYTGSFFGLLNPFGLLCGVLSLVMIVAHGGNYLTLRTEGALQARARNVAFIAGIVSAVLFVIGGLWVWAGIDGYVAVAGLDPAGPANPLAKTVEIQAGAWFANFASVPVLWLVPALGVIGALGGAVMVRANKPGFAFVLSAASLLGIILTPLLAMFPFVMPSSTMPNAGLTLWDCTSSQLTLEIMLFVTLIFLPLVLLYTGWAYKVMSGKLNSEYIEKNSHSLY